MCFVCLKRKKYYTRSGTEIKFQCSSTKVAATSQYNFLEIRVWASRKLPLSLLLLPHIWLLFTFSRLAHFQLWSAPKRRERNSAGVSGKSTLQEFPANRSEQLLLLSFSCKKGFYSLLDFFCPQNISYTTAAAGATLVKVFGRKWFVPLPGRGATGRNFWSELNYFFASLCFITRFLWKSLFQDCDTRLNLSCNNGRY